MPQDSQEGTQVPALPWACDLPSLSLFLCKRPLSSPGRPWESIRGRGPLTPSVSATQQHQMWADEEWETVPTGARSWGLLVAWAWGGGVSVLWKTHFL